MASAGMIFVLCTVKNMLCISNINRIQFGTQTYRVIPQAFFGRKFTNDSKLKCVPLNCHILELIRIMSLPVSITFLIQCLKFVSVKMS